MYGSRCQDEWLEIVRKRVEPAAEHVIGSNGRIRWNHVRHTPVVRHEARGRQERILNTEIDRFGNVFAVRPRGIGKQERRTVAVEGSRHPGLGVVYPPGEETPAIGG
jgi:hypothetical protein